MKQQNNIKIPKSNSGIKAQLGRNLLNFAV